MRYVEILLPSGHRADVIDVLEDERIDYVVDEVRGGEYDAAIRFPLPGNVVETFLDRLSASGIAEDVSVVVLDTETVVSRDLSQFEGEDSDRISRQELQTRAADLTPTFPVYATMTLISAAVATSGLLLDSPAVVVGSMVIAPLIGPALAAGVGTVTDDAELRSTGLIYQFSGIVLAVLGAVLLAGATRLVGLEPGGIELVGIAELEERVAPNLLAFVVALGAGVAGVLSLTRNLSAAIVGVMIAAALIPPAAAAGIAFAWGMFGAATGATALLLVNLLSINFAALVTLWAGGYRPAGLFSIPAARTRTIRFAAIVGLAMALLLVPLASATLVELDATRLESDAEAEVEALLAGPTYAGLEAETVEVELGDDYPIRTIEGVTIVVSGAEPGSDPELADRLAAAIDPHVDDPVSVEVQFIVVEERRAGGSEAGATLEHRESGTPLSEPLPSRSSPTTAEPHPSTPTDNPP